MNAKIKYKRTHRTKCRVKILVTGYQKWFGVRYEYITFAVFKNTVFQFERGLN